MLACDECTYYFHLTCLDPVLEEIPEGEWYCPGKNTSVFGHRLFFTTV